MADTRVTGILMFSPYFPPPVVGGMEKQCLLLSRQLAQDSRVLAISRRFDRGQKPRESADGVEVIRLCLGDGWWRVLDGLYVALIPLILFLLRDRFDVAHIHSPKLAGFVALLSAKALGKKTIMKVPNVRRAIPALRAGVFCGIPVRLLKWADAVVALSDESVEELRSIGFPQERILKVANGVEVPPLDSKPDRPADRPLQILFLGRLVPFKGILDLLSAWERVIGYPGMPEVKLRIYGQGPQEELIRAIIHDRSLADSVELRRHSDDVASILAESDALVLPSYADGCSNAILEAMAAELPIVSTRVGGTMSLVGQAGSKFLHEPGDVEALAGILTTLITDRGLRVATGRQMRARAERHFSIAAIKEKYLEAYRLLLSGQRDLIAGCSDFPP